MKIALGFTLATTIFAIVDWDGAIQFLTALGVFASLLFGLWEKYQNRQRINEVVAVVQQVDSRVEKVDDKVKEVKQATDGLSHAIAAANLALGREEGKETGRLQAEAKTAAIAQGAAEERARQAEPAEKPPAKDGEVADVNLAAVAPDVAAQIAAGGVPKKKAP